MNELLFLIVFLTRLTLYLTASYIAFKKGVYWLMSIGLVAAAIGTTSFITRDELITGIVSNFLGFFILMTAIDAKNRKLKK